MGKLHVVRVVEGLVSGHGFLEGFLEGQTLQKGMGKLRVVRVVEEGLVSGHGGLLEKAEVRKN
jgi:hypothetical protein